jgi:hypothetical protein
MDVSRCVNLVGLDRTIYHNVMYIALVPMVWSSQTMTKEAAESHSFRHLV